MYTRFTTIMFELMLTLLMSDHVHQYFYDDTYPKLDVNNYYQNYAQPTLTFYLRRIVYVSNTIMHNKRRYLENFACCSKDNVQQGILAYLT